MDAALEKRQVKRAYKFYAPAYDFIFDWIFNPGREAAIQLLDIRRGQHVLEVGIGTGLNLPLYPARVPHRRHRPLRGDAGKGPGEGGGAGLDNVTLKAMDATVMDFGDDEFDSAGGDLHDQRRARSGGRAARDAPRGQAGRQHRAPESLPERAAASVGPLRGLVAPVCTRLGWKSNLQLEPLLKQVGLTPDVHGQGQPVQRLAPHQVRE